MHILYGLDYLPPNNLFFWLNITSFLLLIFQAPLHFFSYQLPTFNEYISDFLVHSLVCWCVSIAMPHVDC